MQPTIEEYRCDGRRGCAFGMDFFKWLDDRQFARGVNAMLLVSGVSLLT